MSLFDVLTLVGGLCLFLFGMDIMGVSLEKRAGNSLKLLLSKLTSGKLMGLITGLCVTAVIQSSSATTVMVVGFVNSGIMTLSQAINVIMGANIGTTVTAWILSLAGIESSNIFIQLLKPTSFTPVLALIGIMLTMSTKAGKRRDTGMILLGFATLMFGMDTMSGAVEGLKNVEEFTRILTAFSNPVLGVLAGAVLTCIIQSSSASVGILQALSSTGAVTLGTAVPIIMGQNIGTCVTATLSSVGTNKNARRAAILHLMFNVIGTTVLLTLFCIAKLFLPTELLAGEANTASIAIVHTVFNVMCTLILFPMTKQLERLACRLIPDGKQTETVVSLDERLMATPPIAIERCRVVTNDMAQLTLKAVNSAIDCLFDYSDDSVRNVKKLEDEVDKYEDILGTYLVTLSAYSMSGQDRTETAKLLHAIGDFERISDHAVNIAESAAELKEKSSKFSDTAMAELRVITASINDIFALAVEAFATNSPSVAVKIEPLEQVVDNLRTKLRNRHIERMQKGDCTIEIGFVWSDLLTNLERIADHCSNIAGCVIEMAHSSLDLHGYTDTVHSSNNPEYIKLYEHYTQKYSVN